jgi:hypothetical protein
VLGGANGGGTVFELVPPKAGNAWTEKVLYSFCAQGGEECTDGWKPQGRLTMDTSGDLFGVTFLGGANGSGVAFELIASADKTHWTPKVLHSFCVQANCADGSNPAGRLLLDKSGTLYGLAAAGGRLPLGGVAFALVPPKAHTTAWTFKMLYSFCALGGEQCTDGAAPGPGLVADISGNLYGATALGGAGFHGTVFELIPKAGNAWTEKVLYTFCPKPNCADGAGPDGGVFRDATGNIFGTTQFGGITFGGVIAGSGVVFELKP